MASGSLTISLSEWAGLAVTVILVIMAIERLIGFLQMLAGMIWRKQ